MSKEQIEEMAKKLKAYCYDIKLNDIEDCRRLADFIIDTLGYRKQSEGVWKFNRDGSGTCSECHFTQRGVWDYDNHQNFCGVCGAKMKGGAE